MTVRAMVRGDMCIFEPQSAAPLERPPRRQRSSSRGHRCDREAESRLGSGALSRRRTPRRRAVRPTILPAELQCVSAPDTTGVTIFSMATPRATRTEEFDMSTPRHTGCLRTQMSCVDKGEATEWDGPPLDFPDDVELALRSLGPVCAKGMPPCEGVRSFLLSHTQARTSFCSTDCSPRFEGCQMVSCSDNEFDEEYMSDFESESVESQDD